MRKPLWPALLLAPLLSLADQSVAYAFVGWSCAHQDRIVLHAVHAVFLLGVLATLVPAWKRLRPAAPTMELGASQAPGVFLPLVALIVGAMAALTIVAMWIPQFVLSPCFG